MIYFSDDHLTIRDLAAEDIPPLVEGEIAQGWLGAKPDKLEARLAHRADGKCVALAAIWDGLPVGYVSVYWILEHGPFAGQGVPEIVDFNVLEKFRRRGIGSRLMDVAEGLALERCDHVSIGVGLHSGYGSAQRMYVKRGYVPDGSGVWYMNEVCPPYAACENGDDLILYFSK